MTKGRTLAGGMLLLTALSGVAGLRAQPAPPQPPPADGLDYQVFVSRIQPMFVAKREGLVRCVQCHGRGGGTGGFAIQGPSEGTTVFTEEQSRKNFDSARRLVVPGDPDASRLLMHPLARTAGGDPFHGGGKHWASKDAPEWQTLAAWVAGGTSGHDDHGGTRLRGLPHPDRADLPQGARRPGRQGDLRRVPLGHRHAPASSRHRRRRERRGRPSNRGRTSPRRRRWWSVAIR